MKTATDNRAAAALLERIVDAPGNLIVLEAASPKELVGGLRVLARRSGQAVYLWVDGTGLCSLRDGGMPVRANERLVDTLRFIKRSMHFGIYLVQVDATQLSPAIIDLLLQIARLHDAPARRVVLLGAGTALDSRLESVSLRLRLSGADEARPRLRDGRWVR